MLTNKSNKCNKVHILQVYALLDVYVRYAIMHACIYVIIFVRLLYSVMKSIPRSSFIKRMGLCIGTRTESIHAETLIVENHLIN